MLPYFFLFYHHVNFNLLCLNLHIWVLSKIFLSKYLFWFICRFAVAFNANLKAFKWSSSIKTPWTLQHCVKWFQLLISCTRTDNYWNTKEELGKNLISANLHWILIHWNFLSHVRGRWFEHDKQQWLWSIISTCNFINRTAIIAQCFNDIPFLTILTLNVSVMRGVSIFVVVL